MALSRHNIKTAAMPAAMLLGVAMCRPLAVVESVTGGVLTPILIAAMLFLTFCKVEIRNMRLSRIHLWMLGVQFLGSILVYYLVSPLFGDVVAQGAMI